MVNKKTIIRFCLIYLCVLLPLLGTNTIIITNFLEKVQAEEERKLSEQLLETVELINDTFVEYKNKGVILFENKEFSSNLGKVNATDVNVAARLLQSLRMFDENENEVLIYYGEEELYTSSGMERLNTFFEKTLGCTKKSVSDAIATVRLDRYSIIALHGRTGLEYVLVHIPVGKDVYGYSRSMEVVFNVSKIEKMFATVLNSESLLIELNIGEDESWFQYSNQECKVVSKKVVTEILEKRNNKLLEDDCKNLDITVRLWYDVETQLADFYKLRNINLLLFAVGLLFSVFFSMVLSMIRLSRLKELLDNILNKNESNREKVNWKKNEFDYIQVAINETLREYNSVIKREHEYRKVLLHQTAKLIFHGLLREKNEIQAALNVCGTELYEEYFFILGLDLSSQERIETLDDLLQEDIHYINNENGKKFVFILYELPFGDYDMKERKEFTEAFQETLISKGIICNCLALSKVYSKISMANYAYLEVLSILVSGSDKRFKIQYWEEWIKYNGPEKMWSDNEQLKHFRKAVKEKNEQLALEILKKELLQESNKDKIQNICYMFLQSLTLEMEFVSEEDYSEIMNEISSVSINDEWEFVEQVSHILKKYCSNQENIEDFVSVIHFVEENYMSYELSLNMVADYAGLSKSKTSRLFKLYTGEAYIDYVTRLRMEKAKKLLEETDMSVKEILLKVGYLGIENASKKFKAYFQVNPSAYRAQIRKEKGKNE